LQGAGGIGGLLAMTENSGASSYYHAAGNGDVTALMDASENIVARREFDAFGRTINLVGSKAGINPFWASSQLHDEALDMDSYLYRPLWRGIQRWGSPDPIGERGGINLFRFVGNNPINKIDPLGLQVPPQVIEVLESPEAIELEEVIEADIEAAAEATEAEAETLWSKVVDYFSKAKQTQLNQGLGRSAENVTCPLKNKETIESLTKTANFRIPDLLNHAEKIIGDTKNVDYLSWSPQLQDFLLYAQKYNYQFQLTVDVRTTLSSTVINNVPNIIVQQLP
jgi:RHS repeat-associated protein